MVIIVYNIVYLRQNDPRNKNNSILLVHPDAGLIETITFLLLLRVGLSQTLYWVHFL